MNELLGLPESRVQESLLVYELTHRICRGGYKLPSGETFRGELEVGLTREADVALPCPFRCLPDSQSKMVPSGASPNDSSGHDGASDPRTQAVDQFVALWGKMASTWGINRTMAKIHALLYCVERPLNTDEIMDRLGISRGNANMNLRSLVDWNLIAKTRRAGSRKDYYQAEKDVWQITARIIEERKRREVQPVRKQLQDCADLLIGPKDSIEERPQEVQVLYHRFSELIELIEVFEGVTGVLLPLVKQEDTEQINRFIRFAKSLQESDSKGSESSS